MYKYSTPEMMKAKMECGSLIATLCDHRVASLADKAMDAIALSANPLASPGDVIRNVAHVAGLEVYDGCSNAMYLRRKDTVRDKCKRIFEHNGITVITI